MKIICCGYPRTGTRSLWKALTILGFNALHHDDERIPLFPPMGFDFRVYDDVDAATEEIYWRELIEAYPDCMVILTTRHEDSWWESVRCVVNENRTKSPHEVDRYDHIQKLLYGCASPSELLYKKRYHEHNRAVVDFMLQQPNGGLRRYLHHCIDMRHGWKNLCEFLGVPIPDVSYPWENKRG
jgi:hypothetical protein